MPKVLMTNLDKITGARHSKHVRIVADIFINLELRNSLLEVRYVSVVVQAKMCHFSFITTPPSS